MPPTLKTARDVTARPVSVLLGTEDNHFEECRGTVRAIILSLGLGDVTDCPQEGVHVPSP